MNRPATISAPGMAGPHTGEGRMARHQVIQMIRDLDRGRLLADMQDGMSRIVDAIEAARGAGTGEIVLKIKVRSKSEGTYHLVPTLKVTVPEPTRAEMVTFLDEQSGELMRRDPRQPDLPSVVEADFRNNVQRHADE